MLVDCQSSFSLSYLRNRMDLSGSFLCPVALTPGQEFALPIEEKSGRYTLWTGEKFLAPVGDRTKISRSSGQQRSLYTN
jgi:hypothetical protein